jgi:hypothetical protein
VQVIATVTKDDAFVNPAEVWLVCAHQVAMMLAQTGPKRRMWMHPLPAPRALGPL